MSRNSRSSDGISLYCSREMIGSESNNGFPTSFNGGNAEQMGNIGGASYRRSSYNDLDMVDGDDTGIFDYLVVIRSEKAKSVQFIE